jgi:hypothetical protein
MKQLFVIFLAIHFNVFSQNENIIQIKMEKYDVSTILESEIQTIIDKIKPIDSKLAFIVNIYSEGEDYVIIISTTYEFDTVNLHQYVGFFDIKGKQFLIFKDAPELFFKSCGQEAIFIKSIQNNDPQELFQPYIDELPIWIIRYKKGCFTTIYSSY